MFKFLLYSGLLVLFSFGIQVNCDCFDGIRKCLGSTEDGAFDITEIDGSKLVHKFHELNNYLTEKVNEAASVEDNLDYLLEQYQTNYKKMAILDAKTQKAWKLLLSLRDLSYPDTCNAEGTNIIRQNLAALQDEPLLKVKKFYQTRRADEIFLAYLKKHAEICREIYFSTFNDTINSMNKDMLMRVAWFAHEGLDRYTSDSFNNNKDKSPVERLFFLVNAHMDIGPSYLNTILRRNVKERFLFPHLDKSGRLVIDTQKFEGVFNQYLVDPCLYFIKELGPDVFEATTYEIEYHKLDEGNPAFYRAWAEYRFCSEFTKESKEKLRQTLRFIATKPEAYIPSLT